MPSEPPVRRLLGLDFAALDREGALGWVAGRPAEAPFAYVVTPNADHLARLARRPELASLYRGAALRLLDSRVVSRLAPLFGLEAPPVVTGSDLVAAMLARAVRPEDSIAVLGAPAPAVAALAKRYGLTRIAHHDPPMGFEDDPAAFAAAVEFVETHPARFVLLAVGSPRQERVAAAVASRGRAQGLGLCIGAGLLFLAGLERRAPGWVQQAALEWAWRLAHDPRRMARRYLVDDPVVLALMWREARRRRAG
ncbi:MAG TPA: WecB/TagA/CpsF family glycosyltransferase [Crenalkalicoccus sp.]|nr:WecB/TagA/CpsF family glycosyltransferase [Crenalkalicoccus sp.]